MLRKIILVAVASLFVFAISKLSFAMMCGGHNMAKAHSEHEHGKTEAVKDTTTKESVNGGNKICPVSKEKVGQGGMEPVTYEYEGKIYNFCCEMCIDEFKKDPEKYIKKVEEELGTKAEEEVGQ